MAQAQFHGLREIANDYQKAAEAEPLSYRSPMMNSYSRHSRPTSMVDREQFQAGFTSPSKYWGSNLMVESETWLKASLSRMRSIFNMLKALPDHEENL